MKRVLTLLILALLIPAAPLLAQQEDDAKTQIEELKGQLAGQDEAIKELQTDRDALKKIKVSGYIQMQYLKSENANGLLQDPYDPSDPVKAGFNLRRARLKVTYDGGLTQAVLQADFNNLKLDLKDAYLEFTEPWMKTFALRAGVFNRPNYEVEYSSSQRESPERSRVVRALYPGERDLGAMLTIAPEDLFKLQLAGFNNTFKGAYLQTYPNFGQEPMYVMARLTKAFTLGDLGLDVGAHARLGNVRLNTTKVIDADSPTGSGATVDSSYKVGDNVSRNWFGVEAQMYYDFLGGMKLMGEYIFGQDVNELDASAPYDPARVRDFNGWYLMLVKNLGTDFQVAAKYDVYAPSTGPDYDKMKSELTTNTFGFGLHNYTFQYIRLTLWYDMVMTKTNSVVTSDPSDNLLTVRAQVKF